MNVPHECNTIVSYNLVCYIKDSVNLAGSFVWEYPDNLVLDPSECKIIDSLYLHIWAISNRYNENRV